MGNYLIRTDMQAGEPGQIAWAKDVGNAVNDLDTRVVALEEMGDVPIFVTLANAQAWEAAHPGRVALTLESSTPDTQAPTWPVGTAMSVDPGYDKVTLTLTQTAQDDRAGALIYEVSVNAGVSWAVTAITGTVLVVSGLSPSQAYPAPRVRAKDAAGNVSLPLVASAGFTTLAAPPAPYTTTALSVSPLYYWPGSSLVNLGVGGEPAQRQTTGTFDGAALGGFSSSYHLDKGEFFNFQTGGGGGLSSATQWSYAVVIRVNAAQWTTDNGFVPMIDLAGINYRLTEPADGVASAQLKVEFNGLLEMVPNPVTTPFTRIVGVDCDGTTVTRYVNGVVSGTGPAVSAPSNTWFGVGAAGVQADPSLFSIDFVGLVAHNAPLGATVHHQLAVDAGLA